MERTNKSCLTAHHDASRYSKTHSAQAVARRNLQLPKRARERERERESERKRQDMRDVNFPQEHVRKQLPVTFQWPWHKHKTRIVGLTGDAGSRDAGANCSAGPRYKRSGLLGQLTPVSAAGMCVCC